MTEEEKRVARPTDFPWFRTDKAPIQAWECEGILCAISEGMNALNGYVRIPEDHVWRVFDDYNQIPVEVHGGLTFGPQPASPGMTVREVEESGMSWPNPTQDKDRPMFARSARSWEEVSGWIGFDTAHAWDHWSTEELDKAGFEWTESARRVREIQEEFPPDRRDPWHREWTVERLIQEVNDLARQAAAAVADPQRH